MERAARSPRRRHAFDPWRLPLPNPEFDLAILLEGSESDSGFEDEASAISEDYHRARTLCDSPIKANREFGEWLLATLDADELPLSPASAVYMQAARRRVFGELLRVMSHYKTVEIYTLVHPKWRVPAGSLELMSARRLKARLRGYLNRAGVSKASGLLFGGLDGEFDGTHFHFHFHLAAVGEKAARLEGLRNQFGFVKSEHVRIPIVRQQLVNPPRQLSYLLKSIWFFVPRTKTGKRTQVHARIPPEYEAEYLGWLGNQNLSEIIIMSGMSLTSRSGQTGLFQNQRGEADAG